MSPAHSRAEIRRRRNAVPFQPFAIELANGERIMIEFAENIGFDPTADGDGDFHVITRYTRTCGTFAAVTSVAPIRGTELST